MALKHSQRAQQLFFFFFFFQILVSKTLFPVSNELNNSVECFSKKLRLCLVTVFVFYFQKLVSGNIKEKQFSCIFEIKNMFG